MAIAKTWGWALLVLLAVLSQPATALQKNGFELDNALIAPTEIRRGGPPRDGIPAILTPRFESVATDTLPWQAKDLMLTLDLGGQHYAYPIGILNWHEIVNHTVADRPVLISFCPLCGTGLAFDPVVDGRALTFGVSGLLYNSDLLMYDHQTESLWSQIEGRAVAGPMAGKRLAPIAIRHERFERWRQRVGADGLMLSTDTGYGRDYRKSPYGNYDRSERLYFPVSQSSRRYHPKTWVLGYAHNGDAMVWPFPELARSGVPTVTAEVGGQTVTVHYDPTGPSAELRDRDGRLLPGVRAFWFAWYAFHPQTRIYSAD